MSTLQEHLADLAKFKEKRHSHSAEWAALIVNMVSAHLDELIKLQAPQETARPSQVQTINGLTAEELADQLDSVAVTELRNRPTAQQVLRDSAKLLRGATGRSTPAAGAVNAADRTFALQTVGERRENRLR